MYWPTASARRLHLSPSGLHVLPPPSPQDAAAAHERHAAAAAHARDNDQDRGHEAGKAQLADHARTKDRDRPIPASSPRPPLRSHGSSAHPDAPSSSSLAADIAAAVEAAEREQLVDLARSPDGVYFACLSAHTLSVWTHRPTQVVAAIRRTRASVAEHGRCLRVFWASPSADGSQPRRLALQTDQHVLLLYRILEPRESIYAYTPVLPDSPSLPPGPRRIHSHTRSLSLSALTSPRVPLVSASGERYAPTPQAMNNIFSRTSGELPHPHSDAWSPAARPSQPKQITQALDEQAGAVRAGSSNADLVEIEFTLAMQMDAGLSACSATESHVVVATSDPPAIQVIPWPSDSNPDGQARKTHTTLLRRLPWLQVYPPLGEKLKPAMSNGEGALGGPQGHALPHDLPIRDPEHAHVAGVEYSASMGLYVWLTSDGRAHTASLAHDLKALAWIGQTFHGAKLPPADGYSSCPQPVISKGKNRAGQDGAPDPGTMPHGRQATCTAINAAFSLLAIGTRSGSVEAYDYSPSGEATPSHTLCLPDTWGITLGKTTSLAWTSDGHALAVGYARGWAVFSTYGRLLASSYRESWTGIHRRFRDDHLFGVTRLFWAMGNTEVVLLARPEASPPGTESKPFDPDAQLYALPFIRSSQAQLCGGAAAAAAGYGLLHAGDKLVLYRGRELSEWQVIAPDAAAAPTSLRTAHADAPRMGGEGAAQGQAWQHIRLPPRYLAFNWPIRFAVLSQDGSWVAVAGRRGFAVSCLTPTAHSLAYATTSASGSSDDPPGVGQWRMFDLAHIHQEQGFSVRGGIGWVGHFVLAAADAGGEAQLRVYDATAPLDNGRLLGMERVPAPIVLMRIYPDPTPTGASSTLGASILLYTATNSLYHVRLTSYGRVVRHADLMTGNPNAPTEAYATTRLTLKMMGNLSLSSVITEPTRVRAVEWLVPPFLALSRPKDVLNKATLVILINGRLILLRPRQMPGAIPSSLNGATTPVSTTSSEPNFEGAKINDTGVAQPKPHSSNSAAPPQGDGSGPASSVPDVSLARTPRPSMSSSSLGPSASTPQLVTGTVSSPSPLARSISGSATAPPASQVQVAYEAHVLAEMVELVWTTTTLAGAPKALENTLWAFVEGRGLRVWKEAGKSGAPYAHIPLVSALAEDPLSSRLSLGKGPSSEPSVPEYTVASQGTVLPLDFYPLCLLAARGVVVGMEASLVLRKSLDFALWRTGTATHLVLPGLLRHVLASSQNPLASDAIASAAELAAPYAPLGYFSHALEILLHAVLEDAADGGPSPATSAATSTPPSSSVPSTPATGSTTFFGSEPARTAHLRSEARKAQQVDQAVHGAEELRRTIGLVQRFPSALGVIANCARKTEASQWPTLFAAAGSPADLLQTALQEGDTRTASAFLLVVFTLSPGKAEAAAVSLVKVSVAREEYARALDVLRFLATLNPDDPKLAARVVDQADLLPSASEEPQLLQDKQQPATGAAEALPQPDVSPNTPTPEQPVLSPPEAEGGETPRPGESVLVPEDNGDGLIDERAKRIEDTEVVRSHVLAARPQAA